MNKRVNPGRINCVIHGKMTTIHFEDFDEFVLYGDKSESRVIAHLEMMDVRQLWSKIVGHVLNLSWNAKGIVRNCNYDFEGDE